MRIHGHDTEWYHPACSLKTKEFLQKSRSAAHVIESPSILLVDKFETSLQITLTCLTYLTICCKKPLISLDSGLPSIDLIVSQSEIQDRKNTCPFTEYAIFHWSTHLTECDFNACDEIAETFRKTFESPCTFSWVETYLRCDRSSLSRLHISLEELHQWVSDASKALYLANSRDTLFLERWSMAMVAILDEYGTILPNRPHELYFLDLSLTCPDREIEDLCKVYKHPRKEMHRRVEGYVNVFESKLEVPKARQLRSVRETGLLDLGFFLYDEGRGAFFSAVKTPFKAHCRVLFVQEASTGRSLPPVVDEAFPEHGAIFGAAFSRDKKFLGVAYSDGEEECCTAIWEIDAQLRFTERARFGAWARKIMCRASEQSGWSFD